MLLPIRFLVSFALAAGTCPAAKPGDQLPDDDALQDCLDKGGKVALEAGSPGYLVSKGIVLSVGGTELTSADAADKARLVAHPDLFAPMLRVVAGTTGYALTHVVFDGALPARRRAKDCKGYRGFGTNLQARGSRFALLDVESTGAMCGSAMEVDGSDYEIAGCRIHDNGRPEEQAAGAPEPWSDGLTLLNCERGYVHGNKLSENTDINLVVGGGKNCRIEGNTIEQKRVYGFAGLHIWNFELSGKGNHAGSFYRGNTIAAEKDKLTYGIAVGAHTWNSKLLVSDAGTVSGNTVKGAFVNIAIDGIAKGVVSANTVSGAQGTRGMGLCKKSADYTAADYGEARIDPEAVARNYHDGNCQDVKPANGAAFVRQKRSTPVSIPVPKP